MPVLHYGTDSSVTFQFAAGMPHEERGIPNAPVLKNPAEALAYALHEPLNYPPLGQITTPGDRIVIALGAGIPQSAQITATVIEAILATGIDADGISILRSERDISAGVENPLRLVKDAAAERIRVAVHDPANRRNLAYLAAAESGEPILLNRLLTDADIVLPIGCVQRDKTSGYFGIHSPIYPEFSDYNTQARYRKNDRLAANGHHRELRHEVNHVAWILGVNFTVQVIPGSGDGILHVLAGESEAVRARSRELYRAAWNSTVPAKASLVVAAVEGDATQQTWEDFGHALEMGRRLVDEGGAIAVCCDLAAAPGPALQRMVGSTDRDSAIRKILRDSPGDALTAMQLARALEQSRVYLLSKLEPGFVEELEMIPVSSPDELARLVQRSGSCLVVANATKAMVQIENESRGHGAA